MVRINASELAAVRATATDGITTSARLRGEGMSASTIATRCRLGGPWRRLLPGVILLGPGEPTRRQQLLAAVSYSGPDAVVSGLDALRARGIPLAPSREVQVLVPLGRRMLPREFVSVERTSRVPAPELIDGIPFAPPARATMDAARRETDRDRLRHILALPVHHGLCTVEDFRAELDAGNQRGSAAVREMLRELGPVAETHLWVVAREMLNGVPLPPPVWNMTICDLNSRPIGFVDAWWDEIALGWQFDPRGGGKAGPQMNYLALTAAGVMVVRTTPEQLHTAGGHTVRELTSAFASAARRRRPRILAISTAAGTSQQAVPALKLS